MSENPTFKPGEFCWWELQTSDSAAAKNFYSSLFGWTPRDVPMGEGQFYTMLEKEGKQAAALYGMDEQTAASGIPPHWNSYIGVESADATAAKAKELNGKVLMEPFDVMTEGRMAVLQDPTGATVSVWEPKNHTGAHYVNNVGGVCWNELMTPNASAASEFYGKLFDYDVNVMPMGESTYTILAKGESQTAGVMQAEGEYAHVPPHWSMYIAVENAQNTVDSAAKLGGSVIMPPTPIPGVGTFAIIQDPQGAVFSILEALPRQGDPSQN